MPYAGSGCTKNAYIPSPPDKKQSPHSSFFNGIELGGIKGQEILKKVIEYLQGKGEMEKEPIKDEQAITFLMLPVKKKP